MTQTQTKDCSTIDPEKMLNHAQKIVSDGKAVVDLPRDLDEILKHDLWTYWKTAAGKPFKSFDEAVAAKQPFGLGIGQYHGWLTAVQAYELCAGYNAVREHLRPLIGQEIRPLLHHGTNNRLDNVKSAQGGNSAEYLLSRLKREAEANPAVARIFQEWQDGKFSSVRRAAIAAGIIKAQPTPKELCRRAWAKLSASDQAELLAEFAVLTNK